MSNYANILAFSSALPKQTITNVDLEKMVETSNEWIVSRTGITNRYVVDENQNNSDLAIVAAKKALEKAQITSDKITHILLATCTPETLCPSVASRVADALGIKNALALDINAACTGFLYGLELARSLVIANNGTVLLVASEVMSRRTNWKDRSTCVLFGDGAGAAVLTKENLKDSAIIEDVLCKVDGALGDYIVIGGGTNKSYQVNDTIEEDFFVKMKGNEVYKHAVRSMTNISKEILEKNNYTLDDIDLFIPHQANMRIIEAVGTKLGVSAEKTFVNVQKLGNTSAASIMIALSEAMETEKIKPGMRVLLATFGSGFTWAAAILKF